MTRSVILPLPPPPTQGCTSHASSSCPSPPLPPRAAHHTLRHPAPPPLPPRAAHHTLRHPALPLPLHPGLHITRSVILPEFSALLLPALATLPLRCVELVNTGMQAESMPHLAAALQRPTAAAAAAVGGGGRSSTLAPNPPILLHIQAPKPLPLPLLTPRGQEPPLQRRVVMVSEFGAPPPIVAAVEAAAAAAAASAAPPPPVARPLGPNWWLTLEDLDLSGNNVGDQGLQLLVPHLCDLQQLRRVTMKQAGLTDWSAPQVCV